MQNVRCLFILFLIGYSCLAKSDNFGRLGPHGLYSNHLGNSENWLAIVGDSGVTGAASSPNIEATIGSLLSLFFSFLSETRTDLKLPSLDEFPNPQRFHLDRIEPLTRVPYSLKEFKATSNKLQVLLLNLGAKLSLRLDVHEHSFGYLVGRALGIQSRDIVLVGQDGVMVETIAEQFSRIFEMDTKTLPPLVLVSFTANDLCDVRVFSESVEETAERFRSSLEKTWQRAGPYLKAHHKGTKIYVLAPFDVVGVISNPQILEQKVNVEGQGQITCGQLRHGDHHINLSSWVVLRMLNLMCPSVTQTHLGDEDHLRRLRAIQDAFSEIWKKQIAELNAKYASANLSWTYLEGTRHLPFSTGDLGNDCFHPSVRGHAKIAEEVLSEAHLE